MEEIWKAVPEYEGFYEISNLGRVKSLCRKANVCGGGQRTIKEKFLKPFFNKDYYLRIELNKNSKAKKHCIHQLVARAFIPNPQNFPDINHENGNKLDNSPNNLKWCDSLYNNRHAFATGLISSGEKHRLAKLKNKDVYEIRRLYLTGDYTCEELGEVFGVCKSSIIQIVSNKTWKCLLPV